MAGVCLRGVVKKFGDNEVVHGIDLDIANKEFIVLVGPSGCGKSTILRMIAGLEDITRGEIAIGDIMVNELAPKDRNIAMVFQDYALYPHLTVFQNISFGLEMQKLPKNKIKERVLAAAKILNISEFLGRKPKQLSGGQRQRVAMGRAIVRRPNVFLFDEPLSNLDAKLRTQMRTEIKKLHHTLTTTIIYVTHDQVEAMTLADRIVVLKEGYIEQIGTPYEVYNHPNSVFVAGFIGAPTMNFVPCRLLKQDGELHLNLEDEVVFPVPPDQFDRYAPFAGRKVIMGIRPEYFSIVDPNSDETPSNQIKPKVNVIEPLGSNTLFFFEMATREFVACLPPISGVAPGDTLILKMDTSKIHLFDSETEKIL